VFKSCFAIEKCAAGGDSVTLRTREPLFFRKSSVYQKSTNLHDAIPRALTLKQARGN